MQGKIMCNGDTYGRPISDLVDFFLQVRVCEKRKYLEAQLPGPLVPELEGQEVSASEALFSFRPTFKYTYLY